MAEYATPLRAINRVHQNPEQVANMSRSRFITFQVVSVVLALLTCLTVLTVTVLQNAELQNRFLHWGDTASCFLNTTELKKEENSKAAQQKINWLELLLGFLQHCVLNSTVSTR